MGKSLVDPFGVIVAGNLIRILFRDYRDTCKIVGVADGFGVAEDPNGLDPSELLRLVKVRNTHSYRYTHILHIHIRHTDILHTHGGVLCTYILRFNNYIDLIVLIH